MSKVLTDRTAARLMRLLNARETTSAKGAPLGEQQWAFVRCDSAVAVGGNDILDQCYPATLLKPVTRSSLPAEEHPRGILLTLLGEDGESAVPVEGRCYVVLLAGEVESDGSGSLAGRPRAFGVEAESGDTSVSAWKTPAVRAATTAALPACTYANGSSGVGATLTGNSNGALAAQDGVTLTVNQDLLVKNQASTFQQGIYTLTTVGSGGAPFVLTRRNDADSPTELLGAVVAVTEGSVNADKVFEGTANATITVGTTALPWRDISGDVYGPSSATDNAIARYDGATGKVIQNSLVILDDSGNVDTPGYVHSATNVSADDMSAPNGFFSFSATYLTGALVYSHHPFTVGFSTITYGPGLQLTTGSPIAGGALVFLDEAAPGDLRICATTGSPSTGPVSWNGAVIFYSADIKVYDSAIGSLRTGASGTAADGGVYTNGICTTLPTGGVIGTDVQAWAADLDALAALSGTNDIYYRSAVSTWTAVTVGTSLDFTGGTLAVTGLAIGSDVQAWDADLDALAALSGTNDIYYRSGAATWTAVALGTGLTFAAGTLTLGNVTPDSVTATGTVSGSNLSGTNTGNQTITLTGDVTGSGVGSFAATLATAQPDAHTWASAQTLTVAPVFTDAPGSRTALGGTTVGANLFTLTNPSAITFPRINANNTVDALDAAAFRAAISAGTGGGDALTTNPLSQFAATTSAQLRDVLSDETGTGLAYFQGGDLGTPSAGVLTNSTGTASGLTAGTATALATSRTINGTSFDGSANITVTAAASTLTGATLASGVTASSLTSFGASIALGTPASVVLTNATGLPVAGGGSGRAVTVAYAPICGGTTTTSAQQSVASVGTSGQVLTSAGAAALPTFADPVTGTTAEVVATATQTLGAVANTLEDVTGLTLTLPAAGTYDVFASLLGNVANSSGSYPQIFGSLDLNGSAVANSGFLAVSGNGVTGEAVGTGSIRMLVVAAGAHVLKVRAKWLIAGGGTITTKNLAANANGPIRLNYVRVK